MCVCACVCVCSEDTEGIIRGLILCVFWGEDMAQLQLYENPSAQIPGQ